MIILILIYRLLSIVAQFIIIIRASSV